MQAQAPDFQPDFFQATGLPSVLFPLHFLWPESRCSIWLLGAALWRYPSWFPQRVLCFFCKGRNGWDWCPWGSERTCQAPAWGPAGYREPRSSFCSPSPTLLVLQESWVVIGASSSNVRDIKNPLWVSVVTSLLLKMCPTFRGAFPYHAVCLHFLDILCPLFCLHFQILGFLYSRK